MEGGAVTVTRDDGVASDALPVIWRDGEQPPNPAPATTTTDTTDTTDNTPAPAPANNGGQSDDTF